MSGSGRQKGGRMIGGIPGDIIGSVADALDVL
jgi:hypothetical protein